jgi:hypothetical protein
MKRSIVAIQAILAAGALAQNITFSPAITWTNVTVGQVVTVGWSGGDGRGIDIFLGNSTGHTEITRKTL